MKLIFFCFGGGGGREGVKYARGDIKSIAAAMIILKNCTDFRVFSSVLSNISKIEGGDPPAEP